jgi:hypothetical protein
MTDDDQTVSKRIYDLNIMSVLPSYIRFYDNNTKILAINLMVNVLNHVLISFEHEYMIIWSIGILLGLIKEENNNISNKIKCTNILCLINKKSVEMQNIFFNLDGIDLLLKELRSLYTEERLKEIDDLVKIWKNNKSKKNDRIMEEDSIIQNIGKNNIKLFF